MSNCMGFRHTCRAMDEFMNTHPSHIEILRDKILHLEGKLAKLRKKTTQKLQKVPETDYIH